MPPAQPLSSRTPWVAHTRGAQSRPAPRTPSHVTRRGTTGVPRPRAPAPGTGGDPGSRPVSPPGGIARGPAPSSRQWPSCSCRVAMETGFLHDEEQEGHSSRSPRPPAPPASGLRVPHRYPTRGAAIPRGAAAPGPGSPHVVGSGTPPPPYPFLGVAGWIPSPRAASHQLGDAKAGGSLFQEAPNTPISLQGVDTPTCDRAALSHHRPSAATRPSLRCPHE